MSEEKKVKKRGELLNQLAIISDLLEKANIESEKMWVYFALSEEEINKARDYFISKQEDNHETKYSDTNFFVNIGEVQYMFLVNKNNV